MEIFLFVLSNYVQLVGVVVLLARVRQSKSLYGISVDSQILLIAATLSRVAWSLGTRMFNSRVSSLFAGCELFLSVASSLFLSVYIVKYGRHSLKIPFAPRRGNKDGAASSPSNRQRPSLAMLMTPAYLSWPVLIALALVVAAFFHPGSKNKFTMQTLVAFTMNAEALSMLPQLYIMRKMKEVESLTSHYVGLSVIARIVRMLFWFKLIVAGEMFWSLFVADLANTIFSMDFLRVYYHKVRYGGRLVMNDSLHSLNV